MKLNRLIIWLLALALLPAAVGTAVAASPLANAVVLIIRHGEKPDSGRDLAPAGQQRALAYVHYFEHYRIDGKPVHIDYILASADTKKSHRERLTMTPLSQALRLSIDSRFAEDDTDDLAAALAAHPTGKAILICWHHGQIPDLLTSLGANPNAVLPDGKWPSEVFDWVIELHYDANGHLIAGRTRRVDEHLMPGDE